MLASAIRELASSKHSTLIAAALFEKTVQIWDLTSREKISEFPTLYCSGAHNLLLSPDGETLVAGVSGRGGKVAAYEVPGGKKLWERKVVYGSSLRFHPSGLSILCSVNWRSVVRLDVRTGETLEIAKGIECLYLSALSGDELRVPTEGRSDLLILMSAEQTFRINPLGSSVLDAAFSASSVCVAEARGPVRCFSSVDGSLQWIFETGLESHVQRLHYNSKMNAFFGSLFNFEKGGGRTILRMDASSGACERVCEVDAWEVVFLETTDQFVTSAGEIRDVSDGAVVGRLEFPLREYPDEE